MPSLLLHHFQPPSDHTPFTPLHPLISKFSALEDMLLLSFLYTGEPDSSITTMQCSNTFFAGDDLDIRDYAMVLLNPGW
jgi:hypothetical protein